jgi:hypothetical protein
MPPTTPPTMAAVLLEELLESEVDELELSPVDEEEVGVGVDSPEDGPLVDPPSFIARVAHVPGISVGSGIRSKSFLSLLTWLAKLLPTHQRVPFEASAQ